jgi:hypothetical protein
MEGDQANLHHETLPGDGVFLSPQQKKLFELPPVLLTPA